MSAPLAITDCRPEVIAFAIAMEAKLRANDHKRGWKAEKADRLTPRLPEEIRELAAAVQSAWRADWRDWTPGDPLDGNCEIFQWQSSGGYRIRSMTPAWRASDYSRQRILEEAADVANFAMMVADVCGALASVDDVSAAALKAQADREAERREADQ